MTVSPQATQAPSAADESRELSQLPKERAVFPMHAPLHIEQ